MDRATRERKIHLWKIYTSRGDIGAAAVIKRELELNPLEPKKPVAGNSNQQPEVHTEADDLGVL